MKKLSMLLIIFSSILFVGCSSNNKGNDQSNTKTSQSSKNLSQEEIANSIADKYESMDFSSYDSGITLEDFQRYPEKNVGEKKYFIAKVIQVINDEDSENNHYLATVSSSKDEQTTVVLFVAKNELYKKIINGDEIKSFVHFVSMFEYETTVGVKNNVPAFYLDAYTIVKD